MKPLILVLARNMHCIMSHLLKVNRRYFLMLKNCAYTKEKSEPVLSSRRRFSQVNMLQLQSLLQQRWRSASFCLKIIFGVVQFCSSFVAVLLSQKEVCDQPLRGYLVVFGALAVSNTTVFSILWFRKRYQTTQMYPEIAEASNERTMPPSSTDSLPHLSNAQPNIAETSAARLTDESAQNADAQHRSRTAGIER